jgi:hypothetical protein
MSSAVSWEQLAELAGQLSSTERLRLIERIMHDMATTTEPAAGVARRSSREIRGRVAHPLVGEDAQAWVSRTRSESEDSREVNKRSTLVVDDLCV